MKLLYLFVFFIFVPRFSDAQIFSIAQADSAIKELASCPADTNKINLILKITQAITKSRPEESLGYLREAYRIGFNLNFVRGMAASDMTSGSAHRILANFDSALFYVERSLKVYKKIGDKKSEARGLSMVGLIESSIGNYTDALEVLELSRSMSEDLKDTISIGKILVNIALNYYHLGDNDKALHLYEEALIIQQKVGDVNSQGNIAMNVGLIYNERGQYDDAIRQYNKALQIYKQLGNKSAGAICYNNIANTNSSLKNYTLALENYSLAKAISMEVKDKAGLSSIYSGVADTFVLIADDPHKELLPDSLKNSKQLLLKAKGLYLQSMVFKKTIGDQNGLQFLYLKLSQVAEKLGDQDYAISSLKNHIAIKDSLFNLDNARKIAFLESKREVELKDKKIQIQELEIESRQKAELGYAILIVSILVLSVLTFYLYRARREVKLEKFRNALASDLHDEIGSTLSAISLSSAVIHRKLSDDHEVVRTMVKQIGDRTDSVMDSMSDIVWTIDSKNDRFENVINRMRALANEILEPLGCKVHFNCENDLITLQLDMQKRKNLYLIYKEAINNISKYAQPKSVRIDFEKTTKTHLKLRILDDGSGFDMDAINNSTLRLGGNGLRNMETRAKAINGVLKTTSKVGSGTSVELEFRI